MNELERIIEEVGKAGGALSDVQAETAHQMLKKAKRIFVCGTGRSGLMLKAFAMRLMQLDYAVYVIGETITPSVMQGDLLIAASASGETDSVCNAVRSARQSGADVLTITASPASTMANLQQPFLVIDAGTKFSASRASVQPLGSLFEQMLLLVLDGISLYLSRLHARGHSEMAARHASIE